MNQGTKDEDHESTMMILLDCRMDKMTTTALMMMTLELMIAAGVATASKYHEED